MGEGSDVSAPPCAACDGLGIVIERAAPAKAATLNAIFLRQYGADRVIVRKGDGYVYFSGVEGINIPSVYVYRLGDLTVGEVIDYVAAERATLVSHGRIAE